jgi:three-Cys-motif partner protein
MAQRFGSSHTEEKLQHLEEYLKAYSTALKNQNFRLIYFDAFAGTGDIEIGSEAPLIAQVDEYKPFIAGSAQRALNLGTAFDEYIFVEKRAKNVRELRKLRDQHASIASRVKIKKSDANASLIDFCEGTDWRQTRAVVFLDPFGNQIHWATLEAIAKTKGIDLWYLFPSGLGVFRQISREGTIDPTHEASVDSIFGTRDWQSAFVNRLTQADLFGERSETARIATTQVITAYMIGRMKTIFRGGVLDESVPLGSKGNHMYSLLFAWANPGKAASKLAKTLAGAVLGRKKRGRTK